MTIKEVVTQTMVAVYLQPDGAFTPMQVFEEGSVGIGDITRPGPGARTVNYRADAFGRPVALNATRAAPGQPTFSIDNYLGKIRDVMEKRVENGECYAIQVRIHDCESLDHPGGWKKVYHFGDALTGDATISAPNAIPFADENVTVSTPQQPIYDFMIVRQSVTALTTTETENANGIDFVPDQRGCKNCDDAYPGPDKVGYIACDADSGATANVLYTNDGGATWTAVGTDPGGTDEHLDFPIVFGLNQTQWRVIVGRQSTDAGNAAEYWYGSPTKGVEGTITWTAVELGATNGDIVNKIFKASFSRIYFAYGGDDIAVSTDQGESNSDVYTGSGETLHDFAMNPRNGNVYVVGSSSTILVEKGFSGAFEALTGPTGSLTLRAVAVGNDGTLWVGGDTGLWRSTTPLPTSTSHWVQMKDFGTNNNVLAIDCKGGARALGGDPQILHVMTSQAATLGQMHITLDGGAYVEAITVLSNTGYNAVYFSKSDPNKAFIAGQASATPLATIHKLSPSSGV